MTRQLAVLAGAVCAGGLVGLLPLGRHSVPEQRLQAVLAGRAGPRTRARPGAVRSGDRSDLAGRRWLAAGGAGLAAGLVVGGIAGLVLGAATAAALSRWLSGLEPAAVRVRKARIATDLPIAADLMAALLVAGATVQRATEAVAAAVGGPLGERLTIVVAHLRLGADPAVAWQLLADDPSLAALARALGRASDTGAALAATLARIAEDQRSAAGWQAELAARRVGVRVAAPLGLCFLPAFVLLGIAPVVIGIVHALDLSFG
ncbi:MAG: type II secretion system F family protein [Sporichthyaceae bacterium]|nr:type II secretion system F family protein [Sporichthyaceae bacterium]